MNNGLDRRLDAVLSSIANMVPVDIACIHSWTVQNLRLVSLWWRDRALWEALVPWIEEQITAMTPSNGAHITIVRCQQGTCSALLWPLVVWDSVIGAVTLVSRDEHAYTDSDLNLLEVQIQLIQTVLENSHLTERLITTEAVAKTARAIARNPSPQNIVSILRDYLFDVHIVSCYIALYGPVQHDQPVKPFEYLEIKGSWSRNLGSKIGVGRQFTLDPHWSFLHELDQKKIITITEFGNFMQSDPLVKMLIVADKMQTLTLLALESDRRKLGVLGIATDGPHEFTTHELRTYQIVSEFLTMSTMAVVLQQQADFVQQGRAALLDAVTDSVFMILTDETVLTVNQRFTEMFGLSEREAQGISICKLLDRMRIPGDVRSKLREHWQSIGQDSPDKLEGEFQMTTIAGRHSDIQWYSAPVYQEGVVIGRIYTFHDITADRAAERLRYDLLSRVSHELRTPLTSIQGFAQFILEASGDDLPPLAREYTEIILESAGQLKYLFNDMIEISQAYNGQLHLELNIMAIVPVLESIQKQLTGISQEKNQQIILEANGHLPQVQIDPHRIHQVVSDIVQNAVKYSGSDSKIYIHAVSIDHTDDLPDSAPPDVVTPCVLISVIDEGKGLNQEETDKVFLPFYRTRTSGKIEGVGLGLAIAQSIVEMHRGKIWAEAATHDQPGGRFLFTLPAVD